jgi:ElaB/YqjD/DUF883 family membrane-anchored ribosome-binding protein
MKTATELDKVVDDLKTLGHDADRLVKATTGDAKDGLIEARTRLNKAIVSARRTCERTEEKLRKGIKATDECVRRNPYQTIGVAFGAGLLIGVLALWQRCCKK